MNKLLSFSFVAGVIALVACSDNKSGSGASGTCANYAAALQSASEKCSGKTRGLPAAQLADEASRLATICTYALNAPGNGITAAAVDACAARIKDSCLEDSDCEDLSNARGSLPDGAACGTDAQCAGGDCKKSEAGDTSCGTCVQLAAIGAACGSGLPSCVKGATCSTTGSAAKGTCVARATNLAEGETCYDPKQPSSFAQCASGLTCKLGTGSAVIKCTKRGTTGEACTSSSDCTTDLGCIGGTCGARLADGAACKSGSDCSSGACPTATKKCTAPTYGAAGATCNDDDLRCARGDCSRTGDTQTGTCVDPLADGAACTKAGTTSSKGPYCDRYSTCEKGTCQLFDPSTCK
jgi:hypothetical protein